MKDQISGIVLGIGIRAYAFRVFVLWESLSGKIYDIGDAEIACDDIRFRFYRLEPLAYRRHLELNDKLPFNPEGLGYDLDIQEIGIDTTVLLKIKEDALEQAKDISGSIENFLTAFKIPAKHREDSLGLHNWKIHLKPGQQEIEIEIDTGSTGYKFYESFLRFLSEQRVFASVRIT